MPVHVNTYDGGIDRDSSKNKYQKNCYYKMKNFRLITFEELSHGAVTSAKGNEVISISGATNADDIVIGSYSIRNYLVVWSTNCHDTTGGRGTIWRTDLSVAAPAWTSIYESGSMMLTTKYPIYTEAIGYYESDTVIKVYWTDNHNMIRFIDILSVGPSTVDLLDICPNVDFEVPTLVNIGGGNIYVGRIQYAYQFFNIGGIETIFSPCTPMINLTKSYEGLSGNLSRLYEGATALDSSGNPNNSGKSVSIKVSSPDLSYDMIRVVALLYRNIDQVPDIHIVGEYENQNNLVITDSGYYAYGTITLNAFRTLGNGKIYCKTISQKGNKALIGNIREEYFDLNFDARAYRFRPLDAGANTFECKVYNTETSANETIVKTGVWPAATYQIGGSNVVEDHDCICPYNYDYISGIMPEVASYTPLDTLAYRYQSIVGSLKEGGEGPHLKYEFISDLMVVDDSASTKYDQPDSVLIEGLNSSDSYKNPFRCATLMNHKRDEVYRYGLVGVNTKGQDSFVKWIGDIRMPTCASVATATNVARTTYFQPLGIKFTIDTSALSSDVVAIKIVRVERKKEFRTIYSQGVIGSMFQDINLSRITAHPRLHVNDSGLGEHGTYYKLNNLFQFISPEINYFKDLSPSSTDYIKLAGILGYGDSRYSYIKYDAVNEQDDTGINEAAYIAANYDGNYIINYNRYKGSYGAFLATLDTNDIIEGNLAGIVEHSAEDENEITFATITDPVINRAIDYTVGGALNHEGPSGTCAIILLSSDLDYVKFNNVTDKYWLPLVDYKRKGVAMSQYGGLTYEARQMNTYIECAGGFHIVTGGTDDISTYGGDTYITFFEHLQTIWEVDNNDGGAGPDITATNRFCCIVSFPCETVINTDLDHGVKYSKYYTSGNIHAIRETIGSWYSQFDDANLDATSETFEQDKNMYEYNSVYSQQNTSKVYFCEPLNYDFSLIKDTDVRISLEKTPGEEVDSFMKFLSDNKKTLPTQFGPINDLFLFKNYMIVFFDRAFGTLSIDERAVLPVQNNSMLELGSANNLQFFDFISDRSGSQHPMSIGRIGDGFGWYDAHLGAYGYYNGSTQDLGLTKGLGAEIRTFTDYIKASNGTFYTNHLYGGNFITVENNKFEESMIGLMVTELAQFSSKVSGTSVVFTLAYSPGNFSNARIVVNGVEFYADITGPGTGTCTINSTDNPGLDTSPYSASYRWFIYYKDISKIFTFSSILKNFRLELDIFPQWLINHQESLYDIFYKMVVYKENEGNYGEFYGVYRHGEIEYIVNPAQSIVCIFNNFEYAMEALTSAGVNTIDETWDTLRERNDYQFSVGPATACTYSSATHKITKNAHGLALNEEMIFSGTLPVELTAGTIYYLVNPEVNAFRVATTKGGTPLTFSSNGSAYYHLLDAPLTVDTNVKRRMRTWRIKDLRDHDETKPRMRDTYIRLLFRYLHGSNKKIIVHDLNTYYLVTRESKSKF